MAIDDGGQPFGEKDGSDDRRDADRLDTGTYRSPAAALIRSLAADALALAAVLALLAVIGAVLGFGPLAGRPSAASITDPREMLARSLQATLEAASVHVEGTLQGQLPGDLVNRPDPELNLAGSTITADLRPRDIRTRAHITIPALDINLDTLTALASIWSRTDGGVWQAVGTDSVAGSAASTGLDLNPLTLVDRVRSYLAARNQPPSLEEVACASASGRCHLLTLDAGADPAAALAALLPGGATADMPPTNTTITLATDAQTLRPAVLQVISAAEDGTLAVQLELVFSAWDGPSVIDPPVVGS